MPDVIAFGITGFLVWLLLLSAWHKLQQPAYYRELVAAYLDGLRVGRVLVPVLAALEGGLALLMLIPATRPLALAACAGLLLAYALLMLARLLAGRRDLRCGCAGPASDVTLSPALVLRNLVCVGLCLAAMPLVPGPLGLSLTAVAALSVSLFLVVLYLGCEQLIGNAQRLARGI